MRVVEVGQYSWPRILVISTISISGLSRIHPSTRRPSFSTKRMDSRKHENWTCIGSHDQFSALQVWNWNSNWVREPRRFSFLCQNFLWNSQICDGFHWRQYRKSCRSTRRGKSTNKNKCGCNQVKGKSKTSTEGTCWDDNNCPNTPKKMDWQKVFKSSKQNVDSHDFSKKVVNLLRHNQTLHREGDGAIEFCKIKFRFRNHHSQIQNWSCDRWKVCLAADGIQTEISVLLS